MTESFDWLLDCHNALSGQRVRSEGPSPSRIGYRVENNAIGMRRNSSTAELAVIKTPTKRNMSPGRLRMS